MFKKRLWIVSIAISACLSVILLIGAQRPHPASADIARPLTVGTCNINIGACLQETNNGKGSGLAGVSLGGRGVMGQTKFNSTSSANGTAGVYGTDLSTLGSFDSGVLGQSGKGTGVSGKSTSGVGISGMSTNDAGVKGTSTNGIGVIGTGAVGGVFGQGGSSGSGVQGLGFKGVVGMNTTDPSSDAVLASGFGGTLIRANNSHNIDVLTLEDNGFLDAVTVYGEQGLSGVCASGCTSGNAAVRGTTNVAGAIGVLGVANDASAVGVRAVGFGGNILEGVNTGSFKVFKVDDAGNITIDGQIFTNGSCVAGCFPTRRIESYVPHESVPMSEDVGEAQLIGGRAYIRFDPAFANVVDRTATYLVFITPEGDNRGLYVTNKSPSGFEVRESQGGRSTVAFSYRIVAKPYGENGPRLPMVNIKTAPRPTFVRPHAPTPSAPKTPSFPKP